MDPADLFLTDALDALRRKVLSPQELTDACLARIHALEPAVKAFVTVDAAGARATAQALAANPRAMHESDRLFGIPVGVKDLIDVAGLPTTASSRVLSGNIAASDAPVVASLRSSRAVVIGKTNTQEFAYGVTTPPTRNPWDGRRIPGGSSGGSAAAVATGMCLGALGTDTAGSIRIPAAFCGLSALKPRAASVPMDGIVPLSWSLDSCGPMARSVADVVRMWEALTDTKAQLPAASGLALVVPTSIAEVTEADDDVVSGVEAAVDLLARSGLRAERVRLRPFGEWDRSRSVLLMTDALAVHQEAGWYPARADDYSEETLGNMRYAESLTAVEFVAASRRVRELKAELRDHLGPADVLVLPGAPVQAPFVGEATRRGDHPRPPVVMKLTRANGPINCCGLASVSAPCGLSEEGSPIGVQFVARNEATALTVGLLWQSLSDFHRARPSVTAISPGAGTGGAPGTVREEE
jgi:aspartyl-tRNA(Asn)/glutamyl-tRNA(Gln) amidotransferase subunit A